MKKLRNWCNQNSGFIAFWGIIFMILISILPPIKLELPRIFEYIILFLKLNVTIPVYSILILIILLFIVFRNKLGNWNRLFLKSVVQKVIDIPSNEDVVFLNSQSYNNIPTNTKVHVYKDGGYWKKHPQFPELSNSFWISHTQLITDDEAINGGIYLFEKTFLLSYNIKNIDSAIIYMTIDDFCKITINDTLIGEYSDFKKLSKVNIKEYLIKGENKIRFEIRNINMQTLNDIKYKNYINRKGELNPYGIRYLIRIFNK